MGQPMLERVYFPLISSGSHLYAIGGEDSAGNQLDSVARYDIVNDIWDESFQTLQVGISRHCALEYDDKLWIIAGKR
jgi:N-acetylneuraminic acid mutarotase